MALSFSWGNAETNEHLEGMGIKAVSTPILASETAVGFWRGTAILAWQLWWVMPMRLSYGGLAN